MRYKLQLTLHLPQSDDPVDILNVARYWDEATHPWLDVADVTMVVLLSPDATEKMCFNPGNLAPCLELLPARSIHHSNCVAHIRKEVYERTQKLRALRKGSNVVPDKSAIYSISVETGKKRKAGTNARIFISLTGNKSRTLCVVKALIYFQNKIVQNDRLKSNSYE